jgi:Flp pilus assembly protein TadD
MAKRSRKKTASVHRIASRATPLGLAIQGTPTWLNRDWLWGLILVIAVIFAYQPVWYAGFIWDDDVHLTGNPLTAGHLGFREIWMTSTWRPFPLVIITFWVERALWGLAPLPYHLVNVFQHATCTILLWRVLRNLRVPGAWLGAALWSLHPLQVESVAWISEMKNTESCLFYLLTILSYVRFLGAGDSPGKVNWSYASTLIFAALAMASKSSTLVLPVVLCLCAWWVKGRWQWRHLMRLVPIFLMSVAAAAATLWPVNANLAGPANSLSAQSWPERVATAGDVIWFYLGKLLWPHPLMAIYPRWHIDGSQWVSYLPLLAVVIVSLMLWLKRRSRFRSFFFSWVYFLVSLSPFLCLIDESFWHYSFVEDHLQYLAGMGPLALAGAGLSRLAIFVSPGKAWLQPTFCTGLLLTLGLLSWHRAWVYKGEETLWTDELCKNSNCWVAYNNLGAVLFQKGQVDAAAAQYQKSLKIHPTNEKAHNNLGNALLQKGRGDEAMTQFQEALEINPNFEQARSNLGIALAQTGQVDGAIEQFQKALKIDPADEKAHNNLGTALLQKGQTDEALAQYQKSIEINPNYADAHNNLGNALLQKGQIDEAMTQYQQALEINPNYADAHCNLGNALLQKGQVDEAMTQYQQALEINPTFDQAHNNLGLALIRKGLVDEAMDQYQKAFEINPNNAKAHNNFGAALLQKGQTDKAFAQFQEALRLKPDYVEAQHNLDKTKAMPGR